MTVFKDKKVKQSLVKKGFQETRKTKHLFYFLYDDNGKRTSVNTHFSNNAQEINDGLINKMCRETHLNKQQFCDLINCPLSRDDYYEILRSKNILWTVCFINMQRIIDQTETGIDNSRDIVNKFQEVNHLWSTLRVNFCGL